MAALELLTQLVYIGCAFVAVRLWWSGRTRQSAWSAATFGVLGGVVVIGFFLEEGETLPFPFDRLFIIVVLLLPWLLFRFADSVVPANPRLRRVLDLVGLAAAASTMAVPSIPVEGETPTSVQNAWVLTIVAAWAILAVATTWLLWRAGKDAPGVTRGRVRMLAIGSALLGLAIVASAGPGSDDTTQAVSQLFSMGAAITFLLGYTPPRLLRTAWRGRDERELYDASVGLLSATDERSVLRVLMPGLRRLLGAPGIVGIDAEGKLLGADGDPVDLEDEGIGRVDVGPLHVAHGNAPSMPLFGAGEQELIRRLGLLASLALERVHFVEAERHARATAESATAALAKSNEALEEVNAELEAFVYTTSHDLKNPVIAILGYAEVLIEDHANDMPEEARYYLDRMMVNASFMQSLIRDLLELSRVGRLDTEQSEVDLVRVLEAIVSDAEQRHPQASITWSDDLPKLWANPARTRQLFENLVENACRYAGKPDVSVTVACLSHPGGLRIDVIDDGAGIPLDQAERVFGMFERLDPEGSEGTGMGLAICRRIVELMDGSIFTMPTPKGAHFRIDLPVSADAGRQAIDPPGDHREDPDVRTVA